MNYIVAIIICCSLLGLFILYIFAYYKLISSKTSILDSSVKIAEQKRTLNDYIQEREVIAIQKKLAVVSQISTEEISQELGPLSIKKEEQNLLDEGEILYQQIAEELLDATPVSEEQKKEDIKNLMETVSFLEEIDKYHYIMDSTQPVDVGKGMLYDSISRKLSKIIKTNNWKTLPLIQAEKLENIALNEIKRLEHNDFIETIKIMKDIGTIHDLIEINPQTTLLIFQKEKLRLNFAERVIISYLSDEEDHSLQALLKFSSWNPVYANQIISDLIEKNLISFENEILTMKGLTTADERKQLLEKLASIEQKKQEKEIPLLAPESPQEGLLEQKQIEEINKPPLTTTDDEISNASMLEEILSEIDLTQDIEHNKKESERIENDLARENKKNEEIINYIQQIFAGMLESTGGIMILQAIQYYLTQGSYPDISQEKLLEIMDLMKERQIILDEMIYSNVNIYIYKDLVFDEEMKTILQLFVAHGEMDLENIETATNWDNDTVKRVLKRFYDQSILQLNARNHFFIPGLFNTQ